MTLLRILVILVLVFTVTATADAKKRDAVLDQPFTVQGILQDVFPDDVDDGFVFLAIQMENKTDFISLPSNDPLGTVKLLQPHLGCTVQALVTHSSTSVPHNRQLLKRVLSLSSLENFKVISRSAHSFFEVPSLIDAPPPLNDLPSCGLRKAQGTVIARWNDNNFMLRLSNGSAIKVQTRDLEMPALNQTIEVAGKVNTDLYRYNLSLAHWRPADFSATEEAPPQRIPLREFYTASGRKRIINTKFNGQTLTISGLLKSILTNESGHHRLLVDDGEYAVLVDCSPVPEAVAPLRENSEIEVTGVCVLNSDNWQPGMRFPKVSGLFIVPRTAADITVLRPPPWWTPARFLTVLGGMLALLIAFFLWNRSLRFMVVRKSRALLREQSAKLRETLKIGERTRLAAELHDFHCQNLTAIAYQVSATRSLCSEAAPEVAERLGVVSRMLKSCRADLRHCLWDLRNEALNEPDFAQAIRQTVSPVIGEAKLSVRFFGRRNQLSDSTAHALLCILRELCANAVNHGHAGSIHIAGESRPQFVRFSVQDDGCGFDPAARPRQDDGHFGLDGVQERINRLKGRLEIESAPGRGCYVRLTVNREALQETSA